jgi:hypothetical protein
MTMVEQPDNKPRGAAPDVFRSVMIGAVGFWISFIGSWLLPNDTPGVVVAFVVGGALIAVGWVGLGVAMIRRRRR